MAALTGVMTADFSDFVFEVDRSVVKLKELEGTSAHTSGAIGDFSEGMSAADRTLGLFGVRIGPQIQALRELGGAAGKTASDIGLIGTASLTAAAAVGGWTIGRTIADFFDLDEAIGNAAASLLGFGDVAAAQGAAKIDVLNRAAEIAKRTVTDFDEAMQIIKTHNAAVAESFNTGAARVQQWNREIAAARSAGNLPAITEELKSHNSTLQEISTHYGISTRALEHYSRTLTESAKAQKAWADEARPRYDAIRAAQEELNHATGGWHQTLVTIAPALAKTAIEALNMGVAQQTVAKALNLSTLQVDALDRQMKLNLATIAATDPALGSLDAWLKTNATDTAAWNAELQLTAQRIGVDLNPQVEALNTNLRFTSEVVGELPAKLAAIAAAPSPTAPPFGGQSVSFGDLVPGSTQWYIQGEEGLRKYKTPPNTFRSDWKVAPTAPVINNTFNVVDTESGIARRVGDTITDQIQRGSLVN